MNKEILTCEFRERHDHVTDRPLGPACGAPATHIIYWLDGTKRFSPACAAHLEVDDDAPPHAIDLIG